MTTDRQKIAQKIAKLLALGDETRNDSAAEREAAQRQAARLMEQYGFTSADVQAEASPVTEHSAEAPFKSAPSWYTYLVGSVAKSFGVYPVYVPARRGSGQNARLKYFGEALDVELATYLIEVLLREVESLARDYQKRTGASRKRMFGYRVGVVEAIAMRMRALKDRLKDEKGTSALVHVDSKLARAERLARERLTRLRGSSFSFNSAGAADGRRDGANVSVNRAMQNRAAERGNLLR